MAVKHTTAADGTFTAAGDTEWERDHTVEDGSFVAAKLAASATDVVFGRSTTGAGAGEEVACTAAGRALLDDTDAAAQRTTLGLGTIATQAANNVAITGGSITGITDLAVADGGTGASTGSAACANLKAVFIAAKSAVAVTAPADTAENILATITIPANALGANGGLRLKARLTCTNNANVKTIRVRYTGITGTQHYLEAYTSRTQGEFTLYVFNRNATNSQMSSYSGTLSTAGAVVAGGTTSAVDTTAETTLVITATKATGTDTITLEMYSCELLVDGT